MGVTSQFFLWWFTAWNIGGWVLFFLLAVVAIAWVIFDTASRRIRAVGWMLGTILPVLLLLPSAVLGFFTTTLIEMQNLMEMFFYIGLIGAIIPVVVAVGYAITYQGMTGCEHGHIYEAALGRCPICEQERGSRNPSLGGGYRGQPSSGETEYAGGGRGRSNVHSSGGSQRSARPSRPKANAWLIALKTGRNYQLCQGKTNIGRKRDGNDIVFTDNTVSRSHAVIAEYQGGFDILDLGSVSGTYVNDVRLEKRELLQHGDIIEFGDVKLEFKM